MRRSRWTSRLHWWQVESQVFRAWQTPRNMKVFHGLNETCHLHSFLIPHCKRVMWLSPRDVHVFLVESPLGPTHHPTNKIEAWRQHVTTLHIKPNENFYHLCKIFHQQQDEIPWHKNMCNCLRCYYRFDRSLKAAEAQSRDPVSQQHSNVEGKSKEVLKKALDVCQ